MKIVSIFITKKDLFKKCKCKFLSFKEALGYSETKSEGEIMYFIWIFTQKEKGLCSFILYIPQNRHASLL